LISVFELSNIRTASSLMSPVTKAPATKASLSLTPSVSTSVTNQTVVHQQVQQTITQTSSSQQTVQSVQMSHQSIALVTAERDALLSQLARLKASHSAELVALRSQIGSNGSNAPANDEFSEAQQQLVDASSSQKYVIPF
jgi:hypothetical protein